MPVLFFFGVWMNFVVVWNRCVAEQCNGSPRRWNVVKMCAHLVSCPYRMRYVFVSESIRRVCVSWCGNVAGLSDYVTAYTGSEYVGILVVAMLTEPRLSSACPVRQICRESTTGG